MTPSSEEDPRRIAARLTKAQKADLLMYAPETYAICFDGRSLAKRGLVEWLPPVFGNAVHYGLTPLGLSVAKALKEMENG